jgi:hypothetical protein
MQQVVAHVRRIAPNVKVTENVPGDTVIVHIGAQTFAVEPPFRSSYEAEATWPIYVSPIPRPELKSWECRTMDEISETLRWPSVTPKVRIVTASEVRERAGL